MLHEHRRARAGARSDAPAPQVLHRRSGPVRVDRVLPRVPVGLLVLQRVDVLRPQLSQGVAGGRRRGHRERSASRTCSSWTTSRSSTPSTASPSAEAWSGGASGSSTTSRPAATCCCATRRCSRGGSGWACATCSSGSRRSTTRGSSCTASACRRARTSRRWRSRARSGITVAINIIADPDWDEERFEVIREWALDRAGDRHLTVEHPVPRHRDVAHGIAASSPRAITVSSTSSTRCCRRSCRSRASTRSWCKTQDVFNRKHLGVARAARRCGAGGGAAAARADELRQDAVEVQQRLQPEPTARRPLPRRCVRDAAAGGADGRPRARDLYIHVGAGKVEAPPSA